MNRQLWITTGVILAVSIAFELVFRDTSHAEFFWQAIPGFDFVYGFASCWLIVVGSKWLGKVFIQRDEGYYGEDDA